MSPKPSSDRVDVVADPITTNDKKNITEMSEIERAMSPEELSKDHQNYSAMDAEVAKYATGERIDISPAENKRLRSMIDRRVLVIMVLTYFLQALDKGTLSFTSIMGIRKDLHLVGQEFSWLTTCIYIAILIVEYPINWTIQRVPIGKFLGGCIVAWATILCLHSVAKNFTHMVVLRTLLGIFEAVCQPSFLVMSSMWCVGDSSNFTTV